MVRDGFECGRKLEIHLKPFFFFCSSVFVSVCVFHVWPKTTLFLPVWPRDAKGQTPLALTKGHGRLDLFPGESSSLKPNAAQSDKKMQYDVLQPVKKAHSVSYYMLNLYFLNVKNLQRNQMISYVI